MIFDVDILLSGDWRAVQVDLEEGSSIASIKLKSTANDKRFSYARLDLGKRILLDYVSGLSGPRAELVALAGIIVDMAKYPPRE